MSGTYDRGRDTSSELTEVRTVLSRAENALDSIEHRIARGDHHYSWRKDCAEDCGDESHWFRVDPDAEAIALALANVVTTLDRWRRTGTTRRDRSGRRR